jgi:heptosyltransferase-1
MPAPRVLFVKLSSLGDVVHHFPAVTDLAARRPDARIAWAVEEAYVELVRLHPAVSEVFPVGLRGLKARVLDPARWRRLAAARRALAREPFDYVVDAQGLLKSAVIAGMARGPRFGPDRASAREKAASRLYDVRLPVARDRHAVERNRALVGQVFGYEARGPARYGLSAPAVPAPWIRQGRYAVLLHAASAAAKRWPEDRWIALGRRLAERGCACVLPGGTPAEREAAARIAREIPDALAAPAMGLTEAAALLARASCVAGVDTGLTHLAVALGTPSVGIYVATRPELTGLHGEAGSNLGGAGRMPDVAEVAEALARALP